ncbi:hypothetical protein VIGAN_10124100 [Vigna angularis var. angularis]|uniref:Uncharacterized protein n=1 Tax=Vigna angularis var. angularis TaxID=157739 RepID=A0A0S3T3R8_PHAAN|nr:hypothetical protein VIGAN_10124100 [Vigna angularis var. angularis]
MDKVRREVRPSSTCSGKYSTSYHSVMYSSCSAPNLLNSSGNTTTPLMNLMLKVFTQAIFSPTPSMKEVTASIPLA